VATAGTVIATEALVGRKLISHQSYTVGEGRLDSILEWQVRFDYPDTWTQNDIREQFSQGIVEVFAHPGVGRCLMLITSMPPEVVPRVIEQFEEIADYETRMWVTRDRDSDEFRIKERRAILPLVD
jgi:hypothetical protein